MSKLSGNGQVLSSDHYREIYGMPRVPLNLYGSSLLLAFLPQNTLSQDLGEACYGNVAYCIENSPIVLRPGNCDDNTDESPFGALCIESSPNAGNAVCSAIGSPFPGFLTPTGGLGYPTTSIAPPNITSAPMTTSAAAALSTTSSFTPTTIDTSLITTTDSYGSVFTITGLIIPQGNGSTTMIPCLEITTTDSAGSTVVETAYRSTVLPAAFNKLTGTGSMGSGNGTNRSPSPIAFEGVAAPMGTVAVEAVVLLFGAGVLLNL